MKGIIIAGVGSGVGKTSITTGLMYALSKRMKVQPFKVGPDFIDPMYHSVACGRDSRNLDTFMTSAETVMRTVWNSSLGADICVIEGVRGLFEGMSATDDLSSTAEIAKITGFPVILVINASSLTRSAVAIANGFKAFDKSVKICGVILNQVSGSSHEFKLRDAFRKYCDIPILGLVYRQDSFTVKSRHLGLHSDKDEVIKKIVSLGAISDSLDIDAILRIAEDTPNNCVPCESPFTRHDYRMKVAVPYDDAYCFYYKDNLDCFVHAGIDVVRFSPIAGDPLPDADIYYLGGGYPEYHLDEISKNIDFREGLRNASDEGKVIIGECGGLITLCRSMTDFNSGTIPLCGIFDATAKISGRCGPSYNILRPNGTVGPFNKCVLRGHEFHYSQIDVEKDSRFYYGVERGIGIISGSDGLLVKNTIGRYTHVHALSVVDWLSDLDDVVS